MVYAKTPLGGPAQVLEYLGRYTHRTVIGNERIRAITEHDVAFSVRAARRHPGLLHAALAEALAQQRVKRR